MVQLITLYKAINRITKGAGSMGKGDNKKQSKPKSNSKPNSKSNPKSPKKK
jgi:hypothetical protein